MENLNINVYKVALKSCPNHNICHSQCNFNNFLKYELVEKIITIILFFRNDCNNKDLL